MKSPAKFSIMASLLALGIILIGLGTTTPTASGKQLPEQEPSKLNLPEWVEQGSFREADSDFLLITTEGFSTPLEVNDALNDEVVKAVSKALDRKLGEGVGQRVAIDQAYITTKLMVTDRLIIRPYEDEFTEELASRLGAKYGEFFRGYAQLKLDDSFYTFAEARWLEEQTHVRVITLGTIGAAILLALSVAFGYLRLNQATRGFYSTRLLSISIVSIILIGAFVVWFFQNLSSF